MEDQRYWHPDWHDLAKEPRKYLDGRQKGSVIDPSQRPMNKESNAKLIAEHEGSRDDQKYERGAYH
jgi:hypothetical protein